LKEAVKIIKKLQDNGFYALIVGGAVRDSVMGVEPKDYDISTNALPEDIKKLFKNTRAIGEAYGVMLVNNDYEISTMRSDIHNPNAFSVELLDSGTHTLEELIEKDSSRRDLSCNSIYYDPITDKYYDPLGGVEAIKNRDLSFVGETVNRIKEDPVRILRYFRFLFKYNLTPDREDLQIIYNNRELLLEVSKERIFAEMTKLLLALNVWDKEYFVDLFIMLEPIFPNIALFNSTQQSPIQHPEGGVLVHTFYALKALRVKTPVTVWSTFCHDLGKVKDTKIDENGKITSHGHDATGAIMAEELLRDLKCSNKFISEVSYIVANHMRIKWASNMKKAKVIALIKNEYYENLKEVSVSDSMGAKGNLDWFHWINEFEKNLVIPREQVIKPLVTGRDLIERGMNPGPEFKSILEKAYDKQLEDELLTKDTIMLDLFEDLWYTSKKKKGDNMEREFDEDELDTLESDIMYRIDTELRSMLLESKEAFLESLIGTLEQTKEDLD